jgi:predicted metalloprotease with PDZ domain
MELLSRTIRVQRDFWRDHGQRYFTVTMRPFPLERGSSFQGTGLTQSFATSVSNNAETEFDQLVYLFNHELMHNWVGQTIENEGEEAQYWFSEGFTDYYTARNIAANALGGKDWGYFIRQINETIRLLEVSPVKEAPNSEINYENFWSSHDYQKLPYQRGMLFAFCLDLQIRKGSKGHKSLDDAMRDLLGNARTPGWKLSSETFLQAVNPYLPDDLTPFFQKHIIAGQALPLGELFDQTGLAYTEEADVFDLGFSWDADRKVVTAVNSGSQADAAGVRPGDRLVSWSIYHGSMDREVELVLDREGGRLSVRFFPVKKAQVVQLLDTPANRDLLSAKP